MKQKKISTKGVLLGCLADWAFTLGTGMATGIAAAVISIIRNGPPDNPEAVSENIMTSGLHGLALVMAFSGTILGGFVAGRISTCYELRNASLMGLLSLLTALPFMNGPLSYDVLGYGLTIPCAILGGYLASKKNTCSHRLGSAMEAPVDEGESDSQEDHP